MVYQNHGVVILGATSGLAQALLKILAAQGAALVLHGRSSEKLESLAKTYANLRVATVSGDITDPDLGARVWQALTEISETPVGLVSFVGVPGRIPEEEWTAEAFARLFAVNTAGPLLIARDWAIRMKAKGFSGNVVILSTMQAHYPFEGSLPYSLSKSALTQGIRILAKEFGARPPICFNGLAPGVNEAGMAKASIAKGKYKPYLERGIISRYGSTKDIAEAILFLLKPDLYMTGQILLMDGGLTLRRDIA